MYVLIEGAAIDQKIFEQMQKGIKSNGTWDMELARDKQWLSLENAYNSTNIIYTFRTNAILIAWLKILKLLWKRYLNYFKQWHMRDPCICFGKKTYFCAHMFAFITRVKQ